MKQATKLKIIVAFEKLSRRPAGKLLARLGLVISSRRDDNAMQTLFCLFLWKRRILLARMTDEMIAYRKISEEKDMHRTHRDEEEESVIMTSSTAVVGRMFDSRLRRRFPTLYGTRQF